MQCSGLLFELWRTPTTLVGIVFSVILSVSSISNCCGQDSQFRQDKVSSRRGITDGIRQVSLLKSNLRESTKELRAATPSIAVNNNESKAKLPTDDKDSAKLRATSELSLDSLSEKNDLGANSPGSRGGRELSLDSLDNTRANYSELASSAKSTPASPEEPTSWKNNLRFTVDLASRPSYRGRTGEFGHNGFAGIDLLKVFTDKEGDWGTLTMQTYLTRFDNTPSPPSIFDDDSDFAIVYRIFNFNYRRHGKGKTNFRVGHYELPFGLEQNINTNGTLRQFTHYGNFGLKTDWGATFNGEANGVEYEVGVSRGSGNEWRRRDDPYIVAGRIGTSSDEQVVIGISALVGEVLQFGPLGGTIEHGRVGIDFVFNDEKFIWLGELSAGFQDNFRAYTALFEVDWTNQSESLLAYNQFVIRGLGDAFGWANETRSSAGVRWTPDTHWALSGQFSHFFDGLGTQRRGSTLELQMRYRF